MVSSVCVEHSYCFSRYQSMETKANCNRWLASPKVGRTASISSAPLGYFRGVQRIATQSQESRRVSVGASSDRIIYTTSSGDPALRERPWKWSQHVNNGDHAFSGYFADTFHTWEPPKFVWRTFYTFLLLGLVIKRVVWQRKFNMQQTLQQIARVGPDTLGVAMLTSSFVGMVFTIQFCKEFSKVGLTRVIGGLLGLAPPVELATTRPIWPSGHTATHAPPGCTRCCRR